RFLDQACACRIEERSELPELLLRECRVVFVVVALRALNLRAEKDPADTTRHRRPRLIPSGERKNLGVLAQVPAGGDNLAGKVIVGNILFKLTGHPLAKAFANAVLNERRAGLLEIA